MEKDDFLPKNKSLSAIERYVDPERLECLGSELTSIRLCNGATFAFKLLFKYTVTNTKGD